MVSMSALGVVRKGCVIQRDSTQKGVEAVL